MSLLADNGAQVGSVTKRFAQRLLAIGGNRLELLMVEMQEERQHLLQVIFIALAAVSCALLAGILITAAIVVIFWNNYPVAVLVVLGCLYFSGAFLLYRRLVGLQRNRKFLPETVDQMQKDRACIDKILG
jgi:uncharacterized membrane protein YqjE